MPAPAVPTSFTVVQSTAGIPIVTLTWSHTGTDLDRFEILYLDPGDDVWTSFLLAPKADFGAGPYSFVTGSPTTRDWTVRALNAAGEVST